MTRLTRFLTMIFIVGVFPGLGARQQSTAVPITLPAGYQATLIATGLSYPTHLAYGPDNALYVTQLYSGDENAAVGQVVRLAPPDMMPQVMISNLLKPTGLAWAGNDLYIVSQNRLLLSHFKDGTFSPVETVINDLPFNGRSNGQIELGPDGFLYFESTGTERAPQQSGFIYRMVPGHSDYTVYAHGFKNAYALTWVADPSAPGKFTMYSTEIGDGAVPGVGQPPEKLVVVKQGGDDGWPFCYADRLPNPGWNGTADQCAKAEPPLAMFAPEATPTGLAAFDGQLIVALWNGMPPRLVSVDPASGQVRDWASGFKAPIALLTETDGSLLVLDMFGQSITRIRKQP